jgi:hypothetical protein
MIHSSYKIIYKFKRIERWREEFSTAQIIKLFNEVLNRPVNNQKTIKTTDNIPLVTGSIRRKENLGNMNRVKGTNK